MKRLFLFFIENYRFSLLVMILLSLMGVMGILNINSESRPPVDFARVIITTSYPGASPEEVEEKVTIKIEDQIKAAEGIKDIDSISQTGRSQIDVRLDMDHYNTKDVADEIQRYLQRVQDLPKEVIERPRFLQINAKEIPIMELALVGSNENRQRDQYIDDLKSYLEDDPGVSAINLGGFRKREFQVLLDPQKLKSQYVGIQDVVTAIRTRTQNIPAGFIRDPNNQKLVRVTGQIKEAKELEDIIVRSNFSGGQVKIKDLGTVRDFAEDPSEIVRVNNQPATLVTVKKKSAADTIRTFKSIEEKIKIFSERLKKGYHLIDYDNEAHRIADRLNIVMNNAYLGMILVLIVMMVFLPTVLGILASLSLPIAILGILSAMYMFNINFNNITLLAMVIAIGMLVDNSVVISENYARLRTEGMEQKEAAFKAAYQFWVPLTATVLTTIVAFLPMLVTKGIMGEFIKWIPIVVTISLTISLFESFFLLPTRLQFSVKDISKYQDTENYTHWFDSIRIRFESFMEYLVLKRYWVFVGIFLLLVGSILLNIFGNRFELFPTEDVEYYFVNYEVNIEKTLEKTDEVGSQIVDKVKASIGPDYIKYMIAHSGMTVSANETKYGDNLGRITVAMDFEKAKKLDPKEILRKLRDLKFENIKKITFETSRNGPAVGKPLNVTFRSKSNDSLENIVSDFKGEIAKIPGVVDLQDNQIRGGPEYKIIPDQSQIARLKLSTETIGTALRTALQGSFASQLAQNGTEFYINVRYNDQWRATLKSLQATMIMESTGQHLIPLMSVVKIVNAEGPKVRKRYNYKHSITVFSDVDVEKITSIVLNQKAASIFKILQKKYPEVTATFGGEQESTKESTDSLKSAMFIAIISIFAILVFLFRSFTQSIIILTCIPLGLIGVSLAFFLHSKPLSFLAMIGVVGLAGVVVNSAIVLVSYINELLEEGIPLHDALKKASSDRLRAVLVTNLTTVGGLFPTAYGVGGYDSILVPMTLALAWGLVSGTLLTIIWVPCGYAVSIDFKNYLRKIFLRKKI